MITFKNDPTLNGISVYRETHAILSEEGCRIGRLVFLNNGIEVSIKSVFCINLNDLKTLEEYAKNILARFKEEDKTPIDRFVDSIKEISIAAEEAYNYDDITIISNRLNNAIRQYEESKYEF